MLELTIHAQIAAIFGGYVVSISTPCIQEGFMDWLVTNHTYSNLDDAIAFIRKHIIYIQEIDSTPIETELEKHKAPIEEPKSND